MGASPPFFTKELAKELIEEPVALVLRLALSEGLRVTPGVIEGAGRRCPPNGR